MGVQIIDPQSANSAEQRLLNTVRGLAQHAGIGMPEVGIFDSPTPNAFATGPRRDNALVAVSSGLLARMNDRELNAVLGHEITHVSNGDMVTLALIQGVVNTFVIVLSRIVGNIVDRAVFRSDRGQGPGYFISVIVAQLVLGVGLAVGLTGWRSRRYLRASVPALVVSLAAGTVVGLATLGAYHVSR